MNPEDAEARKAARERSAARRKAAAEAKAVKAAKPGKPAKEPAAREAVPAEEKTGIRKKHGRKSKAAVPAAPAAPDVTAAKPPKPARRPMPHGKQNLGDLQTFLDAQPKEGDGVVFDHRDPLEGEVIMDATARLLASKPVYHYYQPKSAKPSKSAKPAKAAAPKKGKKNQREEPAKGGRASRLAEHDPKPARGPHTRQAPKKGAPVPTKKSSGPQNAPVRPNRGRGRIPPRVDVPKSRQKDSTEQNSLMKPFYIDHD